jgi:hypothetical protein
VRTTPGDPLHPVLSLVGDDLEGPLGDLDTSARDGSGAYVRHIAETRRPPEGALDLTRFLAQAPAA